MTETPNTTRILHPRIWKDEEQEGTYTELAHPADLLLEIRGSSFEQLCERALFALFDTLADLDLVEAREARSLVVEADLPEDRLRRLLAEALLLFYTNRFLAAGATVCVAGPTRLEATLWGEPFDARRHQLLAEIKAVTRHRLSAALEPDGTWRATVLFDM